jgi:hypothetical protein
MNNVYDVSARASQQTYDRTISDSTYWNRNSYNMNRNDVQNKRFMDLGEPYSVEPYEPVSNAKHETGTVIQPEPEPD